MTDTQPIVQKSASFSETKAAALSLLSSATQLIQIYSPNLDPRLLSNRDAELSLVRFIKRSRNSRLQMLIVDEREVSQVDHRLIKLAQNFSSYAQIKLIPKDFHEQPFAFLIVDQRHMLYRNRADRFEAERYQMPNFKVREKTKYFDDVWQQANPASQLRTLHL